MFLRISRIQLAKPEDLWGSGKSESMEIVDQLTFDQDSRTYIQFAKKSVASINVDDLSYVIATLC